MATLILETGAHFSIFFIKFMSEEYTNTLPSGTRLDTYEIEKVLGVGGFGITYLARELNLGKTYAIKELLPDGIAVRQAGESTVKAKSSRALEDFEATQKYFISEARILAGMDHPAVVSVHRLMQANGTCYMVMDYIVGGTLGDYLIKKGGKFTSVEEFQQIFYPLMSGLDILHAQGIIHRDIKPGNIMVKPDGSPVLLDFGAATQTQSKTMTITQMLSAGYSPFEQYTSRAKQGPYTDIYALGATMLKCITGEKPDDASDRVYGDRYKSLTANEHHVQVHGLSIVNAVDWALRMDVSQRPQNIAEWWAVMGGKVDVGEAFEGALNNDSVAVGESPEDPGLSQVGDSGEKSTSSVRSSKLNKRKSFLIGGVVLVALIVIATLMLGGGHEGGLAIKAREAPIDPRMETLKQAQGLYKAEGYLSADFFDRVDKEDLKSLAESGNVEAQFLWGKAHDSAEELLSDNREAVKWYQKAAEQGHAEAQTSLGFMYGTGTGVSKDEREAVNWYRKSADQEYAWAQYSMGRCCLYGIGVSKNSDVAKFYLEKAAKDLWAIRPK